MMSQSSVRGETSSLQTHLDRYRGVWWFAKEIPLARTNREVDLVLVDLVMYRSANDRKVYFSPIANTKFQSHKRHELILVV